MEYEAVLSTHLQELDLTQGLLSLATEKSLNATAANGSAEVFDSVMAKVKSRPPLPGDEM